MVCQQLAAIVAACDLALLMVFQLLLAAGLPLGAAAWGGKNRVLPPKLRWASFVAVWILALACWILLARAGLIPPGDQPFAVRLLTWLFAGYFGLNTVGNIMSKSRVERNIMTPASTVLALCFFAVALA